MQTALTTVVFTSYAVEPEDVGNRLQVTVAAIFTVITVKLTSTGLHQTPYPTAQDRYESVCIRVLGAVSLAQACTGGALARFDASEALITLADGIAMSIVVLAWAVLYNVWFFYTYLRRSDHASARSKLQKSDMATGKNQLLSWKQGFENPDIDVLNRDYTELPKVYSDWLQYDPRSSFWVVDR